MKFVLLTCLVTFLAMPASAQTAEPSEDQPLRSSVELQLHRYGNFFQAREGTPEQSVNAIAEHMASVLDRYGTDVADLVWSRIWTGFLTMIYLFRVELAVLILDGLREFFLRCHAG